MKIIKFIKIIKQQFSLIKKYSPGWVGGWMDGWVDGWMDGRKSRSKDCLQQSKNETMGWVILIAIVRVIVNF